MSVVNLYQDSAKEGYKRDCSNLEINHLFWYGGSIILLWGDEKDQMNYRRPVLEIGGFFLLGGLPLRVLPLWGYLWGDYLSHHLFLILYRNRVMNSL